MVPYAVTPGGDVGMTSEDYRWLLKQCKARADWQLPERLTWNGRLMKDKAARFQYRGSLPTKTQRQSSTQYIGDGATDEMGHLKAPPFGEWRARHRPLRQEPEWTLNDQDVAEAWRRVDQAALDECSPAAMLDLAADVVSALGRWPELLPPWLLPPRAPTGGAPGARPQRLHGEAIRHASQGGVLRRCPPQKATSGPPSPDK